MPKEKRCKNCDAVLPYSIGGNGIATYKHKKMLGIDCGCHARNKKLELALKNIDSTLEKNVKDYEKQKKISPRSKKRIAQEKIYSDLRRVFLNKQENKVCPITNERTTTVHHKKGRIGDLLIDTRYWVALSMAGHIFVEQNPEWAKENGYSLSRLENE